jgi:hypothetical protein
MLSIRNLSYLLILLLTVSCLNTGLKFGDTSNETPFSFPVLTSFEPLVFDAGTNSEIRSLVIDEDNNVYVWGFFTGSMDGVTTDSMDTFLVKLDSTGKVLWKRHFHSNLPEINSAIGIDKATAIVYDKKDKSVYVLGDTESSLVETNTTAKLDLFFAKVNSDGKIVWIKQYGEETRDSLLLRGYSGLNVSNEDRAGNMLMSPKGEIIITFDTMGSLFETNAGSRDAGVLKVSPATGSIISGRQIGEETLFAWETSKGVITDGSGMESVTEGNFAFDGDLIVLPLRTQGSLAETRSGTGSDVGYVVFNDDLTLRDLKHLGSQTYTAWVAKGNFNTGSIAADNQYRSVVVNKSGDYLFFGKTSGNVSEAGQLEDYFFTRYNNGELERIVQYGATTMPSATGSEQARAMVRDEKGNIYCVGHSVSPLFDTTVGTRALIFRVNESGEFQKGIQLGTTKSAELNSPNYGSNIQMYNFGMKDGKILMSFFITNDPASTAPNDTYLWSLNAF